MLEIKKTTYFHLFALKTDNSLFCHRDIPTIHNGYCVSNAVDYAKKNDVFQRFCQLNLWSVIIDFSTEHNLYSPLILFLFLFFEHLEDSCLKRLLRVHMFGYKWSMLYSACSHKEFLLFSDDVTSAEPVTDTRTHQTGWGIFHRFFVIWYLK